MCLVVRDLQVLTPAMRDWMISRVQRAANETAALLRVRKPAGPLKFERTHGAFRRYYSQELDLPDVRECARDARVMYRLPVPAEYCEVMRRHSTQRPSARVECSASCFSAAAR